MFTEIGFETNKMTNKECDRDNLAATSMTRPAQDSIEMYHVNRNLILPEL
jgi:hypothetical protein